MIATLIVESDKQATNKLESLLTENCPQLSVCGKATEYNDAISRIDELNPDLIFLEVDKPQHKGLEVFNLYFPSTFEVIVTSSSERYAINALNFCASGYLIKPIQKDNLIQAVGNVSRRIRDKSRRKSNNNFHRSNIRNLSEEVVGIPTIEGYEFIPVKDIIRCEGMQKCTRVITTEKTDIISSYNLGEFRKLLSQFGFFSPHKSHLINLKKIRKYHKEGNILMQNGNWVPVAKRRKRDFLDQIQHI